MRIYLHQWNAWKIERIALNYLRIGKIIDTLAGIDHRNGLEGLLCTVCTKTDAAGLSLLYVATAFAIRVYAYKAHINNKIQTLHLCLFLENHSSTTGG